MASGRLVDYLGSELIANRPATLDLTPGAIGLFFATDTEQVSLWDGAMWHDVTLPLSPPSGSWSNGALLYYDTGTQRWQEIAPGNVDDVLTMTAYGPRWLPPAP
jgi:hypothetical protein